jgi:hypothetical protein
MTYAAGDVVTASQLNAIDTSVTTLNGIRLVTTGIVGTAVTIAAAGATSAAKLMIVTIWNTTSAVQIGATITQVVYPSVGSIVQTTGANTVTVAFPADGSITAQRTAGTATCEVHALLI